MLIQRFLEPEGYEVLAAGSGEVALAMVKETVPDLVLLDGLMPGMDGFQVCQRLQQEFEDQFVPVVFLTALDGEQDRARALAVGAAGYLVKPLTRDALLETVTKHLDMKQKWGSIEAGSSAPVQLKHVDFVQHVVKQLALSSEAESCLNAAKSGDLYAAAREIGISDNRLAKLIAEYMGFRLVQYIEPDKIKLEALPASFSRANKVVILEDDTIVLSNPFDMLLMDSLSAVVAPEAMNQMAIAEPQIFEDMLSKTPVEYWSDRLVTTAINMGAGDIHLEPEAGNGLVSIRASGFLVHRVKLADNLATRVISRFKALSGMNIAEKRSPQIGVCAFDYGFNHYRLRISTLPTPIGETMHVRVLAQDAVKLGLSGLGMEAGLDADLRGQVRGARGLFLFIGANGAGKSTTVSSLVNELSESLSIISIENPIEYFLVNVNQQQVNSKAGNDEQQLLNNSLNKLPDLLFLGEIRDKTSAQAAMSCARKGTGIISTMSAKGVVSALELLMTLDVSTDDLARYLSGLVSQRLVRKLCPECSHRYQAMEEELYRLSKYGLDYTGEICRPVGCSKCGNSGYMGYTAIYSLVTAEQLRSALAGAESVRLALEKIRGHAVERLIEQCRVKLQSCQCDISEIARVLEREVPVVARGSVLVVDDDPNICSLLERYLADSGYQVTTAGDGVAALFELGQGQFDLVISDINMPTLDGKMLVELMRQKTIETPVLLISASENLADSARLPIAHRLPKPFSREQLLETVQTVMSTQ